MTFVVVGMHTTGPQGNNIYTLSLKNAAENLNLDAFFNTTI